MEPIQIILEVPLTNVAQSVAEIMQQADQLGRAYTSAADKAQAAMDSLSRKQQEHTAIIEANKVKILELETARQKATESAQQGIDQEIAKLKSLTLARQNDITKLEEQKLKAEEKGLISLGATDAEKAALQAVTSQRLIDIGTLRDQTKAMEAVRDTSAQSQALISQGIEDVIRKQQQHTAAINAQKQQIDELTAKKQGASAFEVEQIDQQITQLNKLVGAEQTEQVQLEGKKLLLLEQQSLATSTSEAERQGIRANTDARLAELGVIQSRASVERAAHSTMLADLENAQKQIESLTAKQRVNSDVIEQDKQKIEQLKATRDQAGVQERKLLDMEIEGMRKSIATREVENQTIEAKKIKLQEEQSMALATSDLEKAAIEGATAARLIEVGVTKDQIKAQSNVNETVQEGSNLVQQYLGRFLGIGGVMLATQTVTRAFQEQEEAVKKVMAAQDKLRDRTISVDERLQPLFTEMGLQNADQREAAKDIITQAGAENNVTQATAVKMAVGLAPVLAQQGIGITSPRFKDLVGNASRFEGLDPSMAGNFLADALDPKKGGNANLTGEDFNKKLNALVSVTGSQSRANELLQVYQEDKAKMEAVHFGMDDVTKLYDTLNKKKIAPKEIPAVISQYFKGLTRLKGLLPTEQIEEAEKYNQAGVPELGQIFAKAAGAGTDVDPKRVVDVLGRLDENKLNKAARIFGGPRSLVAMQAGNGWQNDVLPTSTGALAATDSPFRSMALKQEQDDAAQTKAIYDNQQNEIAGRQFNVEKATTSQRLDSHQENLPMSLQHLKNPIFSAVFDSAPFHWTGISPKREVVDTANTYMETLRGWGQKLSDIDSGKVVATPEQRQQLINAMNGILAIIAPQDKNHAGMSDDLRDLTKGGKDTERVLQGMGDIDAFSKKNLQYEDLPFTMDVQAGKAIGSGNRVIKELDGKSKPSAPTPTTQPTTHPSPPPVSINYHNRIVNYGYGFDQIGAPQDHANNMG